MKAFFRDIFEYHHHFNQELIGQLIEHEHKLPRRTISLLSHAINAHQIWNARITNGVKLGVHQMHSLQVCQRLDKENFQKTLEILEERKVEAQIIYTNSKGVEFQNTIHQILFHVANHFSHHKGQIISDIRQSGIAPIVTDYIFYKR